jgi:ABC-type branched-subunit amino acid transport system ATPase component
MFSEGDRVTAVPVLETRELTVRFGGVTAVDRLSLAIGRGRLTGIIGPNGAGKTTFIDAVTGLVRSTGEIRLDGEPITGGAAKTPQATVVSLLGGPALTQAYRRGLLQGWPPHKRAKAGIGRTFQGVELFDEFTVEENLLIPAEAPRRWSFARDVIYPRPDAKSARRVAEALDRVGVAHLAQTYPPELSLGERKLITIARALSGGAHLLFLDEPAAGLNSADSLQLGQTLRELARTGLSVVLVDHDMGLVLTVCDDIHVLDFGKLIASGTPEQIRSNETVIDAYLGQEGHAKAVAEEAV